MSTSNQCTSLLFIKDFTNKGSSWSRKINMSMSLSSKINGGGLLLAYSQFLLLCAIVSTFLVRIFLALFEEALSANPPAMI